MIGWTKKAINLNSHKAEIAIAFGIVLRELRRKRTLSQEALAFKCGLARNYIALMEAGSRLPSLETMLTISKELQIPFGYLAAWVDEKLKEIQNQ